MCNKTDVSNSQIHNNKSVVLLGYADDTNIMGRAKIAVSEVYEELKERAKEVGLNIKVEKIKVVVQNRRTRRIHEILTVKDHDIEVYPG